MSPCTSPTESLRSANSPALRPQTIAINSANSFPPPPPPSGININGTLRAKEHILSNTIPGPESCV